MPTSIFQFDSRLTNTVNALRGIGSKRVTRSKVIQRAVTLMNVVVKAKSQGFKLYTVSADGKRTEIIL